KTLAHGWSSKKLAENKFAALLQEQELLATVNGSVTVARLCEEFAADAAENLEPKTYESYRYACQKFTDAFGTRAAHTIGPQDIQRFSSLLKNGLNDTTRAIVLRSIQRCFNWGVESRQPED